ncbi:MAG: hypothetical protein ACE5K7_06715 [Phycisphaerae bacterium]
MAAVLLPFAFTVSYRLAAIGAQLEAIDRRLNELHNSTQRMWQAISEHDRQLAVLVDKAERDA